MRLPKIISQPSVQFIILHPAAFYDMTMLLSIWLSSILNFQFSKLHYCDRDESQESGFPIISPAFHVRGSIWKHLFLHYLSWKMLVTSIDEIFGGWTRSDIKIFFQERYFQVHPTRQWIKFWVVRSLFVFFENWNILFKMAQKFIVLFKSQSIWIPWLPEFFLI